jgi:ATP-dependent RNA helicase MSS116
MILSSRPTLVVCIIFAVAPPRISSSFTTFSSPRPRTNRHRLRISRGRRQSTADHRDDVAPGNGGAPRRAVVVSPSASASAASSDRATIGVGGGGGRARPSSSKPAASSAKAGGGRVPAGGRSSPRTGGIVADGGGGGGGGVAGGGGRIDGGGDDAVPPLADDAETFASRADLHPSTRRALADTMGLVRMTEIQARTYDAARSGRDVLGRARTGTGKTVAFLLPAIERVLRPSSGHVDGSDVGVLVISPTRELAAQIGSEAARLLSFHAGRTVQVAYGGTKAARDVSRMNGRVPTVLVATPGRLRDLIETAVIGGVRLSTILSRTSVVVLDETDQLLDQGFRREIQAILKHVPRSDRRQTLLFSATVPAELREVMRETMKPDYVEVDCIREGGDANGDGGGGNSQTHAHVMQSHAVIPSVGRYASSVVRVVGEAARDGVDGTGNKIVVFFPTARMVSFFASLFNDVLKSPTVMELHSRKSQGYRDRVSSEFREAESGILLTSDVSARGVDYPGVTHVVQFGMPSNRDQYVHRLGRTGRAGADGKGWLVLGPFESSFLEELGKIHVPVDVALTDALCDTVEDDNATEELMRVLMDKVGSGRDQKLARSGEAAYQAFLGYYLGQMKRMRMDKKESLVDVANEFSAAMGFRRPPILARNMVGKMGLKGVSGIFMEGSSKSGDAGRGSKRAPPPLLRRERTRTDATKSNPNQRRSRKR